MTYSLITLRLVVCLDIRVRKKKDKWICAHGLWKCKTDIEDIFSKINAINGCARITYEGWDEQDFLNKVEEWHIKYPNIKLETINVKYPGWNGCGNSLWG